MLHSLFISVNYSTCFGWYLHPSSGAHTTVSTASGTCQTVTATCRYRGRVGTAEQVVLYLLNCVLFNTFFVYRTLNTNKVKYKNFLPDL